MEKSLGFFKNQVGIKKKVLFHEKKYIKMSCVVHEAQVES